jgi:hypothetical protein
LGGTRFIRCGDSLFFQLLSLGGRDADGFGGALSHGFKLLDGDFALLLLEVFPPGRDVGLHDLAFS